MAQNRSFRLNVLASAAAIALSLGGAAAQAAIVTSGLVNPDPSSGNVAGRLNVGTTGPGTLTVDGGSTLLAERLGAGSGSPTGAGQITVTGVGSSIQTNRVPGNSPVGTLRHTEIGNWGSGSLSVLNGGSFVDGINAAECLANCRLYFSNGAGSSGSLLVSGAGSTLTALGGVNVGYASLFTQAQSGFVFGVPGGISQGQARVESGGVVSSAFARIGFRDQASNLTGSEGAVGQVVIDGLQSAWNLVRNTAQAGAQALLQMAITPNTTATVDVRNGGVMRLDGSTAPVQLSGINVGTAAGADAGNSNGTINVTGPGSRLEFTGGNGFLNLGRGNGNVAQMTVSGGGVVTGTTDHAFGFTSVGRGGGTGTLTVDGNGSLFRMSGGDAVNGGAFLHVGRTDVTAGTGTVNVRNGGRIEIDDRGQVLTSDNQTGMIVGNGAGSVGNMTISGPASTVLIAGGAGKTPYVGIGRDGGIGSLTLSAGGRLEMSSTHVSVPTAGSSYLPGDGLFLNVGQRFAGNDGLPSVGTLTVTGAGSEVVMSGAVDRLLQVGVGSGGSGTLNITSGGTVRTQGLLVGNGAGANGTVTMNGGQLVLDGTRNGGPSSPGGAGMSIGRGDGGIGLMTVTNGSRVSITTTGPDGGIGVGGSTVNPGGNGTLLINGGSTVTVDGPSAAVTAGSQGTAANPGNGLIVLSGAGTSMSVTGAQARVLAGNFAGSTGTIQVGAGATLSTSGLVGVAHNGTGASGGTGLLVVDGTVNAQQVFLAPGGILVGNGTINAAVVNQGGISVGHSPGRMTFNGAFDSSAGQIVLEVEAQPGGGFAVDELVFGDPSQVVIGGADIVFQFLGDTDPVAFLTAGLFDLATFFKGSDGQGGVEALDDSFRDWFDGASFSTASDRFEIRNFSFDPVAGARFDASAVPEPGALALLLLALPLLLRRGRAGAGPRLQANALPA